VINELIIDKVIEVLQEKLIDDINPQDETRAGIVMKGQLQGDPDPDIARISVTVHENDPDAFYSGMVTAMHHNQGWDDSVAEIYCAGSGSETVWNRRFVVKARCLLIQTQEDHETARTVASTIRARIERALLGIDWAGVSEENEYVSRGAVAETMKSEALQSGGPPDSYDYFIKVRFDVQTTLNL